MSLAASGPIRGANPVAGDDRAAVPRSVVREELGLCGMALGEDLEPVVRLFEGGFREYRRMAPPALPVLVPWFVDLALLITRPHPRFRGAGDARPAGLSDARPEYPGPLLHAL